MKAIETTGQFDEQGNLSIEFPLSLRNQKVKLIILIPEEKEWHSVFHNNEAFDFLHDTEEDIYSVEDGRPTERNAVHKTT
ncbi:MAG: hypothetical protein H6557_05545 [Lewinellaceae bacterium]|nr:hypothetical protein [Lewinellaceae bacterium]